MQQLRKVVSRAQYRFFRDALRRIEAGGESLMKDMTLAEICYALDDVDYDALPERAGQAASKPRRQAPAKPAPTRPVAPPPPPEPPLEGVLSLEAYRTRHPEKASVLVEDGELARILSFEGYLRRHPEKKKRTLPAAIGHEWFPGLFGAGGPVT